MKTHRRRSTLRNNGAEDFDDAYAFSPLLLQAETNTRAVFSILAAEPEEQGADGLILPGDEMEKQMASLKSKYPTAESDYLAAARARSAARTQSKDCQATDADWNQMKDMKQQAVGDIDDWENSAREAGNMDSQILIPATQEDENDEDEPKLMLF